MPVLKNKTILIAQSVPVISSDISRTLASSRAKLRLACSKAEVLRLIAEEQPDLVLMDLSLQGEPDWIETAQRIPPRFGGALVYLGAGSDDRTLERALSTAPFGYVPRPFEAQYLLIALRVALARRQAETESAGRRERYFRGGLRHIASALAEIELANQAHALVEDGGRNRRDMADLSQREREVLRRLMANGRVPGIASALHISPHTVRNHLKSMFRKLGVSSQAELIDHMQSPATATLH